MGAMWPSGEESFRPVRGLVDDGIMSLLQMDSVDPANASGSGDRGNEN